MYKIIGADGKEYGPITADQLRQWIAEGRANAQTRVLVEGSTDWKPLSAFPEFITPQAPPTFATPTPFAVTTGVDDLVTGPAIGLMASAILGILLQAFRIVAGLIGFAAATASRMQGEAPWANALFSGPFVIVTALIGMAVGGFILFGAIKMRRLESYGLAMAVSIIAMIPCISPCCLVGLPIGIWSLVVLSKPEVKSAFH